MSKQKFKVGAGIDLEGLLLTKDFDSNAIAALAVDGNILATTSYVDTAIGGVTLELSGAAGTYLDWNSGTLQFDVNIPSGTYLTSSDLSGYATETYVGSQGFLTSSDLYGYATETYVGNQGFITSSALSGYATETYVGSQGFLTSADLSGYVTSSSLSTTLGDYTTTNNLDTTVGGYGYLKSADLPTMYTDSDAVYAISNALYQSGGIQYVANSGFAVNTNNIAGTGLYAPDSFTIALNLDSETLQTDGSGHLGVNTSVIATKAYVDATAQGLDVKASVKYATISTENYSGSIDGIDPSTQPAGTRFLIKDSLEGSNGIYVWDNTLPGLVRADDSTFDSATGTGNLTKGSFVFVESGTNAGKGFVVTNIAEMTGPYSGMYDNSWTQFSETGNYITSVTSEFGVSAGELSLASTLTSKTFQGNVYFQSGGGAGSTNNYITVDNSTGDMTVRSNYNLDLYSTNNVNITANSGDIVLNADGYAYVGSVGSGNQIATQYYVDTAVGGVLPSQATNSGKYLTTDGSTVSWATIDALPAQSGNNGKYLTTDGSTASWATIDLTSKADAANPTITGSLTLDGTGDFTVSSDANIVLAPVSPNKSYIGSVSSGNEIATHSYVTGLGYITASDVPANYITSVSTDFSVTDGLLELAGTYLTAAAVMTSAELQAAGITYATKKAYHATQNLSGTSVVIPATTSVAEMTVKVGNRISRIAAVGAMWTEYAIIDDNTSPVSMSVTYSGGNFVITDSNGVADMTVVIEFIA